MEHRQETISAALGRMFRAFMGADSDFDRAGWIDDVNDELLRRLPGAQVMFLDREGSETLEVCLLLPFYAVDKLQGSHALAYPSIVVTVTFDGTLCIIKNRYGARGELPSLEGTVVLSFQDSPRVAGRFTTMVPDGR